MRSWHYSSSTTPTRQKASPASTWAGLFVPLLANSTPVLITSPLTTSSVGVTVSGLPQPPHPDGAFARRSLS
jgi:hypothetical protein